MGRNRGQGNQGGDKKKGDSGKVKIRHLKNWRWPENRKHNMLREARRAEKKLNKLLARGWANKPGGIVAGSRREGALHAHINRLKAAQALSTK